MVEVIFPTSGPVLAGEERERTYAEHQPEYMPLRTLVGVTEQGRVLSRWRPTPEQRKMIAEGKDIFLVLLTFHRPLAPSMMLIADDSDAVELKEIIGLPNGELAPAEAP
jgi:hypothetical protein